MIDTQSTAPTPQHSIRNPQSAIRNPQSAIRNPQSAIRNPQSKDPQSSALSPQHSIRNPQSAIRNPRMIAAVAVLCAVPFLFHAQALWRGEIAWFMDTLTQAYPFRIHAAHLLWQGELPLWNRTVFAGVPFLANPQWGILYPGHWLMFAAPGPRSYTLINVIHLILLGTGVFAYVRLITGGRTGGRTGGALMAGVLAQTGGWSWAHLAFVSYLQTAAWMPWMMFAFEKFRRAESITTNRSNGPAEAGMVWAFAAGLFGVAQLLAGAPQLALYCQTGLAVLAGATWLVDRRAIAFRRLLLFVVVEGIVALGLSAPQWMPAQTFQQITERSGSLDLPRVLGGALDLRGLIRAWFGGTGRPEDAESILYPGVFALLLALNGVLGFLYAPRGGERRRALGWSIPLLVVAAAAMLASWSAIVPALYQAVPLFSHFHDPRRILFLAFLCCVILSGLGWQTLWQKATSPTSSSSLPGGLRRFLRTGLVILACAACVGPVLFALHRIDIKTIPVSEFQILETSGKELRYRSGHPKAGERFPLQPGERFFAQDIGIQISYNYTRVSFAETLLPNIAAMYGLEDIQGYDPLIPWRYAVYMRRLNAFPSPSVTLYPGHFGLARNPDSPWLSRFGPLKARGPVDCFWPFFPPWVVEPGKRIEIPLRRLWQLPDGETLLKRTRVYAGVESSAGMRRDDPSITSLSFQLLREGKAVAPPFEAKPSPGRGTGVKDEMLDTLWPDITPYSSPLVERWRMIPPSSSAASNGTGQTGDTILVENRASLPVLLYSLGLPRDIPAFEATADPLTFASTWKQDFPGMVDVERVDVTKPEARKYYEKWAFRRPWDRVTVEVPPNAPEPPAALAVLKGWHWIEKRANRLRIALPAGHRGGWLVLSEPYAPGWRCEVDGVGATIYPADVLFRAVPVSAGAREVTMTYWPPGLTRGLGTACLTALLVALVWIRMKAASPIRTKTGGPNSDENTATEA